MLLTCAFISAIAGVGIAIILVEKQSQWPATILRPLIIRLLGKIHSKLPDMLSCSVCTSFWATLFADLFMMLYTRFQYISIWPISGFLAVFLSWFMIELLNAIDPIWKRVLQEPVLKKELEKAEKSNQ